MDASAGEEVLITHVFEAPRERVFRAWTDPDEVRGRYELTMVQRDGGAESRSPTT